MWDDPESLFKNTSIQYNFNSRGTFRKILKFQVYSDLTRSINTSYKLSSMLLTMAYHEAK